MSTIKSSIGSNKNVLVFDIETDSVEVDTAQLKWFGAYSYKDDRYYIIEQKDSKKILQLIKEHKVLVGFNCKEFDIPIIENNIEDIDFKYKIIVDLYNVSKLRLPSMGFKPYNYKLKTLIELLRLDDDGNKGDIDYNVFKKETVQLSNEEIMTIKHYLKQDIVITKKLFEWFFEQFKPIRKYLNKKDKDSYNDVKASTASLAYRVICQLSGLDAEFVDQKKNKTIKVAGGHHILPRHEKVRGRLVSYDVTSAYPHSIMMCNLLSPSKTEGESYWSGGGLYNLKGKYKFNEMGPKEKALQQIFLERIKAKKEKNRAKNMSYKIIINSLYGTINNSVFKHTYDPVAAGDCTAIVRTWMQRFAAYLESHGLYSVYGFTDSVTVLLPEEMTLDHVQMLVDEFVEKTKQTVPFPMDTFNFEIEKDMKFIWIVTKYEKDKKIFVKNCYLWVNSDDSVEYRSTLFNKNTPQVIMKLFKEYMVPKIVKELDINFSEQELRDKLKEILNNNIELAGEEYKVNDKDSYASHTCMQHNIAEAYGPGQHYLIPNLRLVGIGRAKHTKRRTGLRYCTYKEFVDNGLTVNDIDLNRLMKHLKPFFNEKENLFIHNQKTLKYFEFTPIA